MGNAELDDFKKEIIEAIKTQTDESIRVTGQSWVEEAVTKTTISLFTKLGIDCKNPLEMQRDFAHIRKSRLDSEDVIKTIRTTVIKWGLTIMLAAILAYDKFGPK